MTGPLESYWAVLRKDLVLEFRTKDVLYSLVLFSVLAVVVIAFGFTWASRTQQPMYAPGSLWLTLLFSATVGFNRFFDRERENRSFEGILLTPVNRISLFAAKATAQMIFNLFSELIFVPLVILFFNLPIRSPGLFVGQLVVGTAGVVGIGTLFAALLMDVKVRDVLLPLVVFPLTIPILLAGVKLTLLVSVSKGYEDPSKWLYFTIGYAILSWVISGFIFGRYFRR